MQRSGGLTALQNAIVNDCPSVVKVLVNRGADVDAHAQNSAGRTALMMAATRGATRTMRVLLDDGFADVDLQDKQERTALHYAVTAEDKEAVDLLLAAGASTSKRDEYGRTALDIAEARGYEAIAALLR